MRRVVDLMVIFCSSGSEVCITCCWTWDELFVFFYMFVMDSDRDSICACLVGREWVRAVGEVRWSLRRRC